MPKGDIWAIKNEDEYSFDYRKDFLFDFTGIAKDDLKILMKEYVWHEYRAKNKRLVTLCRNVRDLKNTLNRYMILNDVKSVRDFQVADSEKFQTFLRLSLNKKGKPYSSSTIATSYSAFRSLIYYGQAHQKEIAPVNDIFLGNQRIRNNQKPRIDYVPDEIMNKINAALPNEKNIYIRTAILIFQYTGMRMSELITLKESCLQEHLISGYTLQWMDYKNRKERNPVPLHSECARAVIELLDFTKELRFRAKEEIKEYLFIRNTTYGISRIEKWKISDWLLKFTKEHEICGNDGKTYRLSSHQFRRTLATDMLSKGVHIKVIQETLGHSSVVTTSKYYADIKDKQRAEIFYQIGIIGNIMSVDESIISDAEELSWFQKNAQSTARMCDGYCTRPVRNGEICDRLLKRQKCLTCSRFITTPEYLEIHRQHLSDLKGELSNNTFGNHYAEHLLPTIGALQEIIKRLEELPDDKTRIQVPAADV